MTYRELYETGRACLQIANISEADIDACLLLEFLCNTDRNYLLAHGNEAVCADTEKQYLQMIEQRSTHIPLQHLTNEQDFMGLQFYVNQDVLVPRQDTECLVEEAMREIQDQMAVLDVCTGSGCIIISLMRYKNDLRCVATDLSNKALEVAERNRQTLVPNGNLQLIQSDLFENIQGSFDVILSNPPYIRSEVIPTLDLEVREHEPHMALDGTADGLYFYRRIAEKAPEFLNPGGRIFFEIGYDQGQDVIDILTENGYADIKVVQDLAGLDRVVSAVRRN